MAHLTEGLLSSTVLAAYYGAMNAAPSDVCAIPDMKSGFDFFPTETIIPQPGLSPFSEEDTTSQTGKIDFVLQEM